MLPAWPGLFSTNTGCPSAVFRLSPTSRAIVSEIWPGGNGTMMRMICVGYSPCASAGKAPKNSEAKPRKPRTA